MSAQPQQLSLAIRLNDQATFDNFCCIAESIHTPVVEALKALGAAPSTENASAEGSLLAEGSLPAEGSLLAEGSIYLWGASGSGVSHLLQATCHHARLNDRQAQYLPLADLMDFPPRQLLEGLELLNLVCLDDIQVIAADGGWQEAVFHLFNRIRDRGGRLLIGADSPPAQLDDVLPDLTSRLGWGPVFQLATLDDEQKSQVIQFRADRRGMHFDDDPARYLVTRSGRSMVELMERLNQLEQLAVDEKRKLTIPFLKKTFDW